MEAIQNIIGLVKAHWVEVLAAIGAVDILLGIIVKFTPFKWDDNLYVVFHNAVSKLGKK